MIFEPRRALCVGWKAGEMYIPKHHHYLYSVSLILFGFWIKQKFGDTLDVWFTAFYLQFVGLMHGYYIMQAGILYQGYITAMNTPDPKPVIVETKPALPAIKDFSEWKPVIVSQQVVEFPAFNLERRFWIDVLRMYDFDPATQKHVDLTEERWVIQKKMFSQKPFENMKRKAEHFGLLKRKHKGKSAGQIVKSREAVALVASGNPLPNWSPPLSK